MVTSINKEKILIYTELNKLRHIPLLEGELWKGIDDYERYEISNYGRVKRLAYTDTAANQFKEWEQYYEEKIYLLNGNTQDYPQVTLRHSKLRKYDIPVRIHRLVAAYFLAPPSDELVAECKASGLSYVPVEHEDDDPRNPHVDNLRLCSPSFNNKKAANTTDYTDRSGSNQHMAELTEADVTEILKMLDAGSLSQTAIGEMFGVKQITISNIKTGRSWAWFTGIPVKARSRKKKVKALMERVEI